jgi:two-component system, chemotaxis family, chemotaxis protein CheY
MRVLIVDDSKTMRTILRGLMEDVGFAVVEAADGKEGLARMEAGEPFDLALVDWNMPEMNGLELVRAVRRNARCSTIRLLMVTTESEMPRVAAALAAGADEYLMKPFDREALLSKLSLIGLVDAAREG